MSPGRSPPAVEEKKSITFKEAIELFRKGKAITKLKPSSRHGYEEILRTRLLGRFDDRPLEALGFEDISSLDAKMVEEALSASRRRNVVIVVRSILRGAHEAGQLRELPKHPTLPKKG